MVVLSVQAPQADGSLQDGVMRIFNPDRNGVRVRWDGPAQRPLLPLGEYQQRVVQLRRRGVPYAYEIVKLLTPSATDASQADLPPGDFVEHDLDESGSWFRSIVRPARTRRTSSSAWCATSRRSTRRACAG